VIQPTLDIGILVADGLIACDLTALMSMEPDWWIELESTYRERIAQRKELYVQHGIRIVNAMPGSKDACHELAEAVIQFLCTRYPNQFRCDTAGIVHNAILKTQTDIRTADPLVFLLENVPEDFMIVQEDKNTGLYHFRAGVSTSAIGWDMTTKISKPLHEIHDPVPYYQEKMQYSMDRCVISYSRWKMPPHTNEFVMLDSSPR